jgi:hypothetical protein
VAPARATRCKHFQRRGLARANGCHAGGRGFESRRPRHSPVSAGLQARRASCQALGASGLESLTRRQFPLLRFGIWLVRQVFRHAGTRLTARGERARIQRPLPFCYTSALAGSPRFQARRHSPVGSWWGSNPSDRELLRACRRRDARVLRQLFGCCRLDSTRSGARQSVITVSGADCSRWSTC